MRNKIMLMLLALTMMITMAACGNNAVETTEEPATEVATEENVTETVEDATEEPVEEKTELNFAMTVDPDGLDPHRTVAASTFQITNNIYDTLVKVDTAGNYIPGLAKSWVVSEDGKTITFALNEGIMFHNGNPLNAEAVKQSFERLKGEESPRANDYVNITGIEATSDYEIVFATENLDVELVSNFAYPWAAVVDVTAADSLKNAPVGTGSYKLKEWIPQQYLVLEAYDGAMKKANIETIRFKVIPDAAARVLAFNSGELDIMGISGDQVALFEGNEDVTITENPMNSIQLMAMNLQNEYLANPLVRQAINMAVDKDSLIENVWYGFGQKIGSHYPPILKGYADNSNKYEYDVEEAKKLLTEAGYPDGFTVRMALPKNYQAYVDAGQVIANDLKAIGINAEIEIVEWAYWLSEVYTGRNYDLTVVGHTGRLDPYVLLARYDSESGENYFNYQNDRVNEILRSVKQIQSEEERMDLYEEIQNILAEEVPAYYIQSPYITMVMQKDVKGFETYPLDIYELADLKL